MVFPQQNSMVELDSRLKAMDEALKCKETGEEKVIAFNFSGHGHFDLSAYDAYLGGKLEDYEYPDEKIKESLKNLPEVKEM